MPPAIKFISGQMLFVGGQIAMSADCCCSPACDTCPTTGACGCVTVVLSGVPDVSAYCGGQPTPIGYDINGIYFIPTPDTGGAVIGSDSNCMKIYLSCLDGMWTLSAYDSLGNELIAPDYQVPGTGEDCCPQEGVYTLDEGGTYEIIYGGTPTDDCRCSSDTSECPMTYTAVVLGTPDSDGTYVLYRFPISGTSYFWVRQKPDGSDCTGGGPKFILSCANASGINSGTWVFYKVGGGPSWQFHLEDQPCPTEGTFLNALGYSLTLTAGGTPCT